MPRQQALLGDMSTTRVKVKLSIVEEVDRKLRCGGRCEAGTTITVDGTAAVLPLDHSLHGDSGMAYELEQLRALANDRSKNGVGNRRFQKQSSTRCSSTTGRAAASRRRRRRGALRRTRTAYQPDAQKSLTRVNTVRCAAPIIGIRHIWRGIWLDRLRISRGLWVGSTPVSGGSRPAGEIEDVFDRRHATFGTRYALAEEADADASLKSTMQARGTDCVALSNGRGQIARSPAVKEIKPLELSYP